MPSYAIDDAVVPAQGVLAQLQRSSVGGTPPPPRRLRLHV